MNAAALPFKTKSVFFAARRHAFEHDYSRIRTSKFLERYTDGDVVLIMLGPLGRVLASEWCLLRSKVTFIDMGSFWDAELWGRHQYGGYVASPKACMFKNDLSVG